ncbi:MAG: translation elongation factor 4 [bacterium]|nr:translation elongation factor 4 [bacterium]
MNKSRNFSIIAHIDHGKSTLADRFLEITDTVPKSKMTAQFLDQLDLEKERGITIKLAPVTMNYQGYVLNLIDTPGHVDFSYEVSRSLACVEGAILLVDATKGIEAQTLSNLLLAKEQSLTIIPAINKIDSPNAQVEEVKKQLVETFGFAENAIYEVSAKTGQGVEELLNSVVARIPEPKVVELVSFKALIFDSFYDSFKGVVAYVRVFAGQVKTGDRIKFIATKAEAEVVSVGVFRPDLIDKEFLAAGEIGWLATGLKEVQKVRVGDTITTTGLNTLPWPGYKEFKPMVFAGIFPSDRDQFTRLKEALDKLKLNDASLRFEPENSPALGFGVRAGFLGLLHMEIVQERLEREFDLDLILSSPTVGYRVVKTSGEEIEIANPSVLPEKTAIKEILEPWVKASVISLQKYFGSISQVLYEHRGVISNTEYISEKIKISCELPLAEIISQFYDQLKTVSSGFASFDYELAGYKPIDAVKLEILVAKEPIDALSQIIPKEKAFRTGKALVEKLKEVIPRQQFEVSIQAAISGKIIAAEKVSAFRKDVTAKLYGGDRTRKDKLLQKQKKGKQRLKKVGRVEIPQEAFLAILKI